VDGDPGPTRLSIQVASFRTRSRADEVLEAVSRRTGQPGLIVTSRHEDGTGWYAILLGAFQAREEAEAVGETLRRDGTISQVVLRPIPESWLSRMTPPGR
jgi:hypothetical protein